MKLQWACCVLLLALLCAQVVSAKHEKKRKGGGQFHKVDTVGPDGELKKDAPADGESSQEPSKDETQQPGSDAAPPPPVETALGHHVSEHNGQLHLHHKDAHHVVHLENAHVVTTTVVPHDDGGCNWDNDVSACSPEPYCLYKPAFGDVIFGRNCVLKNAVHAVASSADAPAPAPAHVIAKHTDGAGVTHLLHAHLHAHPGKEEQKWQTPTYKQNLRGQPIRHIVVLNGHKHPAVLHGHVQHVPVKFEAANAEKQPEPPAEKPEPPSEQKPEPSVEHRVLHLSHPVQHHSHVQHVPVKFEAAGGDADSGDWKWH